MTHVTDIHISTKNIELLPKKIIRQRNKYLTEEESYGTNKYMKRHLISLRMRKMYIKITIRKHFRTNHSMTKIKKSGI